ncbi:MAG: VWA domain-containing protein [Myxococcales bacterium]|nr:VWA domain-containing protein [Myxococcales bacterium]
MKKPLNAFWTRIQQPANRRRYGIALGCALVIAGVLVLIRSGQARPPSPHVGTGGTSAHASAGATRTPIVGRGLKGQLAISQSAIEANGARTVFAEIELAAQKLEGEAKRAPLATAIVLDHSGSMAGQKLADARDAVARFVSGLGDDDYVAFIIYDDGGETVVPLTRVGDARARILERVQGVRDGGGTNIPGGLSLGAAALTAAPADSIRRVILFSDGLDGSGRALAAVKDEVRSWALSGTSVSALGIGSDYDARYMSAVAEVGNGNYGFLGTRELMATFVDKELSESTGTVADHVTASVVLPVGWRAKRAFGAVLDGDSGTVRLSMGALGVGEPRRVTLELEVDAPRFGSAGEVTAEVAYRLVAARENMVVQSKPLALASVASASDALASRDVVIWGHAQGLLADLAQERAVIAWQEGRTAEAAAIARAEQKRVRDTLAAMRSANASDAEMGPVRAVTESLGLALDDFRDVAPTSKLGKAKALSYGSARARRGRSAGEAAAAEPATVGAADEASLY